MSTIRLLVAYDGTAFHGWARQRDASVRTIEGALGEALARVLRGEVRLSVAGRTDAGVHARGQVVSFVTASSIAPERLQTAVNGRLAPEVVVRDAAYAPDGFDARFSASAREYRYVVDTGAVADPFTARFVWHRPGALSVGAMRAGRGPWWGSTTSRRSAATRAGIGSTVRDLQRLTVSRDGQHVVFSLRANAFLHQMVRSIVGTLVAVGEGTVTPEDVASAVAARDRSRAAAVAPPQGLTLERVVYGRRREERRAGRSPRP